MNPSCAASLRILASVLGILVFLFSVAAATVTQPTFGVLPGLDGPRADPGRLRRDVEFLTGEFSPRDSDHPKNLARAADYLRAQLAPSGARVTEQTFQVRSRTYRNVVASFGPESGPVLVVGAHYDSFGDFKRAMRSAGDLPVVSLTAPRMAGLDGSDQINYWDRGIPAVIVTDTADVRNPHYHTSGDRPETLDYQRMAKVVDGVANAVLHLATRQRT